MGEGARHLQCDPFMKVMTLQRYVSNFSGVIKSHVASRVIFMRKTENKKVNELPFQFILLAES